MALTVSGQPVGERLAAAFSRFEKDSQLHSALAALYVMDAASGKVVFNRNGQTGMAPASTLKVITSVTAYELLGKDFRYLTEFGRAPDGTLYIKGSGDPTLGSWRWKETREDSVLDRIRKAYTKTGGTAPARMQLLQQGWDAERIPDGWIWQDIGNYYGAGAAALNWRENQFDVFLRSGSSLGAPVAIAATEPAYFQQALTSKVTAAARGTGDNTYIYLSPDGLPSVLRGTIPVNESRFSVSGAMARPEDYFVHRLADIWNNGTPAEGGAATPGKVQWEYTLREPEGGAVFHRETSPPLDSIIYWFNCKSINLYGEALVKTIGFREGGEGSTDKGVEQLRHFWKSKGLSPSALQVVDGSGLSPLNRVTVAAQVTVLAFARTRPWFAGFYQALPEYNGMKMKSGTISGVKGFTGYHTAKDGRQYIFSFLVNNYNGSASALVRKMYAVLDELK